MKILFVRSSAFATPRLCNQAMVLAKAGVNVTILHWERGIVYEYNRNKEIELLDKYGIVSFPIFVGRAGYNSGIYSLIKRYKYWVGIISHLRNNKYDFVHAIDLDSAFPIYFAKVWLHHRFKYHYDIADYIQTFKTNIPRIFLKVLDWLDYLIIKHSNAIILPDINRLFRIPCIYRQKVFIVNNAPFVSYSDVLKNKDIVFDVQSDKINLFYYGAFSSERGLSELISCIPHFKNFHFYFAGIGLLDNEIVKSCELYDNVTYLGRLSYFNCLYVLSLIDISYICYDPKFEHNRVAAPNKLYEALLFNKPVIVSNNTSIDIVVKTNKIGYCIDYSKESLFDLLVCIEKKELIEYMNSIHFVHNFSYESSIRNILNLYGLNSK